MVRPERRTRGDLIAAAAIAFAAPFLLNQSSEPEAVHATYDFHGSVTVWAVRATGPAYNVGSC